MLTQVLRQATTPVAVLLASWALGVAQPNLKVFLNVSAIVVGVVIASFGEIEFIWTGVLFQIGGLIFEALRLTMVQRLLSSAEFKMDPLVSLYYFAPVCAAMNLAVALIWEIPKVTMAEVYHVGLFTLFLNGLCAFLLNVSVVFLVSHACTLQPASTSLHPPYDRSLTVSLANFRSARPPPSS
jgi:drug/metabolite transporter (DMT)-like permease